MAEVYLDLADDVPYLLLIWYHEDKLYGKRWEKDYFTRNFLVE